MTLEFTTGAEKTDGRVTLKSLA